MAPCFEGGVTVGTGCKQDGPLVWDKVWTSMHLQLLKAKSVGQLKLESNGTDHGKQHGD